jgi:hypothetical protein
MKKLGFIGIVFFCAGFQLIAQSKPFIGYDKVAWGSSIDDVRKAYGIGNDIKEEVSEEDENIVTLTQYGNVPVRRFFFNQGKLYRVCVIYNDEKGESTNKNQEDLLRSLKTAIVQRYGNQTETDHKSWTHQPTLGPYGPVLFNQAITIYGKFAPDIEVTILYTVATTSYPIQTTMSGIEVYYTWKKFRDEYQASKLKL